MEKNNGFLIVKLKNPIDIGSVSIDHISPISTVDSRSTPKNFQILGCFDEICSKNELLGEFEFKIGLLFIIIYIGKGFVQNFIINHIIRRFQIFKLKINSNYGNDDYTCLYRFRIHKT
jgi:SUN domain-containing protein 1/2